MIICMSDIICITNRNLCNDNYFNKIAEVSKSGVKTIVLREKDLPEQDYEKIATQVLRICEAEGTQCILHNFVSVAKRLGVKAIHLPIYKLRELSIDDFIFFKIIGASCHSVEEAIEAEKLGCTYIFAGHIFETDCKKDLEPRGLDFLSSVCRNVQIPVYAIGGISQENYNEALKAGASGVCIMSGLMRCEKTEEYVKQFGEL